MISLKKQLHFKVNARHIGQLGRELVTDYITALVEIIKNSYDADADGVKIVFDKVKTKNGRIIIIDTGSGMSQKDIEEKWMVIGTNNKVKESHSQKGRKYAGKKGIGRFAVERLAERVKIFSFTENEVPFKFMLNWNSYEEVNIISLNQRFSLLKHDPFDIDSAKYVKAHIDYIINNSKVSADDKSYIKEKFFITDEVEYTFFLDNIPLINSLTENFLPLLEKYKSLEVRIEDIVHDLELLTTTEANEYIYDIEHLQSQIGIQKEKTTGLIMVLENLRDTWTQKDLSKIQKELRLLVAPDFLDKSSFKPMLEAEEFDLQNDFIVNDVLEMSYAKLDATIDKSGQTINIRYKERLSGKSLEKKMQLERPIKFGKSNLELYYFVRDAKHLSNEMLNLTHARSILDEFCGVKIYRDGFHVKPYGTPGNDWLLLDQTKVKDPHGYLIGNNQVIGIVNISEEDNPLLIDATNRERIIENESFFYVKDFIQFCINFITDIRRDEYLQKKQEEEIKKADFKKKLEEEQRKLEEHTREEQRKQEVLNQQKKIREILENGDEEKKIEELASLAKEIKIISEDEIQFYKTRLEQERKINEESKEEQKKIYNEALDNKERELSLYKNLATLGILTGAFGHETADIINRIVTDISYTKKWYPVETLTERPGISDAYNKIFNDFQRVQGYSELIVNFVTKKKRSEMEIVNFQATIEEIGNTYNNIIRSQNIELEFEFSTFENNFKMYLIDFESIIINLLTNSFEALKQTTDKKIKVSCHTTDYHYEIIFMDNGKGIQAGQEEFIFSPFMTTKDNGIGLGLSIVKDIISRYKGIIEVGMAEEMSGAKFTILFPKEGN